MIKKIKLNNYGIHKDFLTEFSNGINIILGKNRSGKTQLLEAIGFALFGKTQNSKIQKIIHNGEKAASVTACLDEDEIKRKRTETTSSLQKIKKEALEKKLNVSYKDFLSLFYITAHEQQNLFNATYLRHFLISIFQVDKYLKIYDSLNSENKILQSQQDRFAIKNKKSHEKAISKLTKYTSKIEKSIEVIGTKRKALTTAMNEIHRIEGQLSSKKAIINKNKTLINKQRCHSCNQVISSPLKSSLIKENHDLIDKIDSVSQKVKDKKDKILSALKKVDLLESTLSRKRNKANEIIYRTKTNLNRKEQRVDKQRLTEIASVMKFFHASGFPSFLILKYLPSINVTANNLIKTVFNDIELKIQTERPSSGKPDFRPVIYRNNEVFYLEDLCGSERVLINLCFRLAVIVVFKQLIKTDVDFMLIDEGLEKVDNENSLKLVTLLNGFLESHYLNQIIMVTHKDSLKNLEGINYINVGAT